MSTSWLGLDIGSCGLGFAEVQQELPMKFHLKRTSFIQLRRGEVEERLSKAYTWLREILITCDPAAALYIEEPFVGKSIRSALLLGTVKGLVAGVLLSLDRKFPISLPAVQIKKVLTGNAHASKEQVAAVLHHYLIPPYSLPANEHATDAVAIAIAACLIQSSPITRKLTSRAER
ncbi:MAG: crossover junction endodeoxyribonuclease RuvC [Bacteroidia bacterium]|nr:crossover junction endodeoxyribonuclease RuvC [Bacteroidia bacterium]MDW8134122.1 crossover junction endodeoxyribonuclease RuvC [Bacteroidia bacterium]